MQELQAHITRVHSKLQALLKQHEALVKQHAKQQETITQLEKEKEDQQQKIKLLEEQQYILKSAAGNMSATEKKDFDKIIGKYIREIDKCIALLSE
jgi:hypothetical protein